MLLFETTTCLLIVAVFLLLWLLLPRQHPLKYPQPPGPPYALPVIGHLYLMSRDPREQFSQWRRQYGDIFSLRLGDRLVVVLSSCSVLKEAFVKHGDVFSHRPATFLMDFLGKKRGVILSSGDLWREQRKVSVEILRELGMGRNVLAERIYMEITDYIKAIESEHGLPFSPVRVTHHSIANIIFSIIFGKRYEHGDPKFDQYLVALENCWRDVGGDAAVMNFLPWLRFLPGDLFHFNRLRRNTEMIDALCKTIIAERRRDFDRQSISDFIGAYLRLIDEKADKGGATTLNDDNLWQSVADLFAAGMETTATSLCWALAFFLHYPEVQDKCYKQIQETVGTGRLPTLHDKPSLPYIEATAMEVLRKANIVPFSVQHSVSDDIIFHGYSIPKGTMIFPLMESVLMDREVWSDPEMFRPERFLSDSGTCTKPDEFIPFSLGRRLCLGESLARMELFLFLSAMVQRFQFLPPDDGQLPSLQGILGATVTPHPFTLRAVLRE